jgi:hypothetical protein
MEFCLDVGRFPANRQRMKPSGQDPMFRNLFTYAYWAGKVEIFSQYRGGRIAFFIVYAAVIVHIFAKSR